MKKKPDSMLALVVIFCAGLAINGLVAMQSEEEQPIANVAHMQLLDYKQVTN